MDRKQGAFEGVVAFGDAAEDDEDLAYIPYNPNMGAFR